MAGGIRHKATCLGLSPSRRANTDTCADYLIANPKYLDYAGATKRLACSGFQKLLEQSFEIGEGWVTLRSFVEEEHSPGGLTEAGQAVFDEACSEP